MSTTAVAEPVPLPARTELTGESTPWVRGIAWPALRRWTIAVWRHLLTLYVVARLGLLWASFCGATGLADQRTRVDRETGRAKVRIHHVPKLDKVHIGAHGATLRVKLRPGQDLATYTGLCPALRHTAHCQAAATTEINDQPGYLQLRLLRRDPPHRVIDRPREVAPGCCPSG